MFSRPQQHQQMLMHAVIASTRSTCSRRRTGAVITDRSGRIISIGYNGVASGAPHCNDGHECAGAKFPSGENLHLCNAIHAEVNALVQCPVLYRAYRIYCTVSPCDKCLDLLIQTPIVEVHYYKDYAHDNRGRWIASSSPHCMMPRIWNQHDISDFFIAGELAIYI